METQVRCSSCGGSGQQWVGSPTDPNAHVPCLNCHGRGVIYQRVASSQSRTGHYDAAENQISLTPEERQQLGEDGLANLLGLIFAGVLAIPLLIEGTLTWWIPILLGIGGGCVVAYLLKGPVRWVVTMIFIAMQIVGKILQWTLIAGVLIGILYVVIICIQVGQ